MQQCFRAIKLCTFSDELLHPRQSHYPLTRVTTHPPPLRCFHPTSRPDAYIPIKATRVDEVRVVSP